MLFIVRIFYLYSSSYTEHPQFIAESWFKQDFKLFMFYKSHMKRGLREIHGLNTLVVYYVNPVQFDPVVYLQNSLM